MSNIVTVYSLILIVLHETNFVTSKRHPLESSNC